MNETRPRVTVEEIKTHVAKQLAYRAGESSSADSEEYEKVFKITNPRSLADAIIETTTNLKGKQLSARALRRAEARKLKPKYR